MNRARTFLTAASVAALLAGCNSNVDGGTVAFAPESFPEIPASASMTVNGTARVLALTLRGESVDRFDLDQGTNPALVDISYTVGLDADKNITSLRVAAPDLGLDQPLEAANATVAARAYLTDLATDQEVNKITAELTDGSFAISAATSIDGNDYSYQTFGTWVEQTSDIAREIAYFTAGFETAAAGVPTSGTMYYRGIAEGILLNSQSRLFRTVSTVDVGVDFGEARTFTFATNDSRIYVDDVDYLDASLDLTGGGALSGSSMSGTVSNVYFDGTVDAQLYGPGAEEVGGTFAATAQGGAQYIGSFGAPIASPF